MKNRLALVSTVVALTAVGVAAPAAQAGVVCDTTSRVSAKYLGPIFETANVHMDEDTQALIREACSVTP